MTLPEEPSKTFFDLVPLNPIENLKYRIDMRQRCMYDLDYRAATMLACQQDILYWLSTWVWIYEPRPKIIGGEKMPTVIPFIPWEHQIPIIRTLQENLGFRDIAIEKSRGEGMSWISVLFALWDWIFDPMSRIGLVSRNRAFADSADNPDSMMWKIVWEIDQLPIWMVGHRDKDWKRSLEAGSLMNLRNGSSIGVSAATGDVGRGGRYKWFIMDELGAFPRGDDVNAVMSTQHATNSRLFISTPAGSSGAYYDIISRPDCFKLSMHWSQNPTRNRGLYRIVSGKIVEIDPISNPLPPGYAESVRPLLARLQESGYNIEKGYRSPWYDNECDRPGATPQRIAQELDLDYAGSKVRVFGDDFFRIANETVRNPTIRGMFTLHPETSELIFERAWDGNVSMWTELDHRNKPPTDSYVVSADICTGSGGSYTSNSVCQVINLNTREQVLEFASTTIKPAEFADICMGVAKWFWEAYLAWEINGPGAGFGERVISRNYGNVYRRMIHWKRTRRKTTEVGWHTGEKTRPILFAEILRAVVNREVVIRSEELLKECGQYIFKDGKIVHQLSLTTEDDSSKGQAHGDRVISIGVGLMAAKDRPQMKYTKDLMNEEELQRMLDSPPAGTMAYRMRQMELEEQKLSAEYGDGWDTRTNGELATRDFSSTLGWRG